MGIKRFFSLMRRASTVFDKYHESLIKKWRLNSTSYEVLMFFADNPENNTARDLCRMLSMKTGIVSVAIEQLSSAGLLERRTDPEDRRIQRLYLTEKAMPIAEEGREIRKKFLERLKQAMSEEEFRTYYELSMKLRSTVDDMAQEVLK